MRNSKSNRNAKLNNDSFSNTIAMSHTLLLCEQVATINLVRHQELCVTFMHRALIITQLRNRAALIYDVIVELYLKYYRDYIISDVPLPQQLLPVIRREG